MTRGNLAIRDHVANGKDLYLFEKTSEGFVQSIGQMICAGYEFVAGVPDRNGDPRTIIVFYLHPFNKLLQHSETAPAPEDEADDAVLGHDLWTQPLDQLRASAMAGPLDGVSSFEARRSVYRRSEAIRVYVLRRAAGQCEGCGHPAPFETAAGRPYLEPHHTRRLADGGPDHPGNVIALCPTCHRRAHYASDADEFNGGLIDRLHGLEPRG
jgi:5-methylcytosine-specific restriction enzyme A